MREYVGDDIFKYDCIELHKALHGESFTQVVMLDRDDAHFFFNKQDKNDNKVHLYRGIGILGTGKNGKCLCKKGGCHFRLVH